MEKSKPSKKAVSSPAIYYHCIEPLSLDNLSSVVSSGDFEFRPIEQMVSSEGPVIVSGNLTKTQHFISHSALNRDQVILIYACKQPAMDLLSEAFNRYGVFRVLDLNLKDHWPEILLEAQEAALERISFLNLLKAAREQKEKLETLNTSLEVIVLDRTQNIEKSRKEEDEKLSRLRTITRFIKDLSAIESIEEAFIYVRKDLRKHIGACEPQLLFSNSDQSFSIMTCDANFVRQREVSGKLPEILFRGWATDKLTQMLAQSLARPVVKPFVIHLEIPSVLQLGAPNAKAYLLLECGQAVQDSKHLSSMIENYVSEIHEPLSMIFDRLLLESEMVKTSFRWEQTFDNFRDPIAIIDVDFNIIRSNRKFSTNPRFEKCFEVLFGRSSPCEKCPIIEGNRSHQVTLGGDQKNYRLRSYPIVLSQSESPTTFVHQYIDETKSKELYLRLVQNEKLSAIGLLAGNLAHELNNPLTGIRSIAQVLSAEVEDLQLQQDLQQIQEAAHRSQAIIHNLMEFSSKKTNPIAHVALDELVEKTVVFLKTALRQHDYRIDLDARSSHIKVDPLMMSQVVFNIINNACQAMKTKGVLKIKTWRDQNHVYFQVEDAGEGIAKENLSKIFEPFFTTKKEGQGTGLGLSLAKKIIEEYGGEISVTSTLGAGAQFTVKLPSVDQ